MPNRKEIQELRSALETSSVQWARTVEMITRIAGEEISAASVAEKDGELDIISLQELISKRSQALAIAARLMDEMHEAEKCIIKNIG